MTFDGPHDGFLCTIAQGAQGIGQSWADRTLVHLPLDHGREPRGQSQAARYPGFAPVEKTRDAR